MNVWSRYRGCTKNPKMGRFSVFFLYSLKIRHFFQKFHCFTNFYILYKIQLKNKYTSKISSGQFILYMNHRQYLNLELNINLNNLNNLNLEHLTQFYLILEYLQINPQLKPILLLISIIEMSI